ncbi:hypothetical protein LCGC14_0660310 [marine sediment metagenome]|uniref:Uncharacterized protein n=1 Tax=marine sediment metagenome TaxID=412755 RepID=A0A0F9U222_9ZZZZ
MNKKQCLKIQWAKLHTVNGKPVCPDCGEPAEMIIGLFANACWAHIPKKKEVINA